MWLDGSFLASVSSVLRARSACATAQPRLGVRDVGEEAFGPIGVGLFLGHGFLQHSQRVEHVAMPCFLIPAWPSGDALDLMEGAQGAVLVFEAR